MGRVALAAAAAGRTAGCPLPTRRVTRVALAAAVLTKNPVSFAFFRAQGRSGCALPGFHSLPADKPANVIYQKCRKAYHHRKIPDVLQACHCPQHDPHAVIGSVCQGKIRASPECQIHREKAGGDRDRAWNQIGRVKMLYYSFSKNYASALLKKDGYNGLETGKG